MAHKLAQLKARFQVSESDVINTAPATKLINNISVSTSDVQIDPSRNLWFRLFTPTINSTSSDIKLPLIVYFHGGGFRYFGPETKLYDTFCSHLAAKVPAIIASINYRLSPNHKYPTQYEDCYEALNFIDAQNTAVLPDFSSCFIAGDSAGGNLAHHVTVRAIKNAEQFNNLRINGLVCVQPLFGGQERTESELRLKQAPNVDVDMTDDTWREFLPAGADRDHPAVNVFKSAEEMKSLEFPATLVFVGGFDPLQDWGKRYAEWLKNCGKEVELIMYPDAVHVFYAFPREPEFDMLLQTVTNFINKHEGSK